MMIRYHREAGIIMSHRYVNQPSLKETHPIFSLDIPISSQNHAPLENEELEENTSPYKMNKKQRYR